MKARALCLLLAFNPAFAEDLLSGDDWSDRVVEPDANQDEAPSLYDQWQRYGKLRLEHGVTLDDSRDVVINRTSANVLVELPLAKAWYASIKGRARYYHDNDRAVSETQRGTYQGDLQHAWLQWSYRSVSIKAGKQKIVWGKVDGSPVLDVINPVDVTEPLLTDLDNIRSSQWSVTADWYLDHQRLSLFAIPRAQFNRLSIDGLDHALNAEYPTAKVSINEHNAGKEFGIHYELNQSTWDWALMAATLQHNMPQYQSRGGLEFINESYSLLGTSVSVANGSWLFNGDGALKTNQAFDGIRQKTLEAALGIEYSTASQRIKFGLYSQHGVSSEYTAKPSVSVSWSKPFWHDTLDISALWMKNFEQQSEQGTLMGQYDINDTWQTSLAYSMKRVASNTRTRETIRDNELSLTLSATF